MTTDPDSTDSTAARPLPFTTQLAMFARAADGGEWEWEEIARACLIVAADAAAMAGISPTEIVELFARELAESQYASSGLPPLNADGSPVTADQRIDRGEWSVAEPE